MLYSMMLPLEGVDFFVYLKQMPPGIYACVVTNPDGTFSMYLDPRRDFLSQLDDYTHELWHIINDDFYNGLPISIIEGRAG